jgi:hypothetical protein
MSMPRTVATEILDGLPADDPAARRSRSDLRRVHRAMGTRAILLRALRGAEIGKGDESRQGRREHFNARAPLRVLELGAGDGTLMLGVARVLAPSWPRVEITLLDRQKLVGRREVAAYADIGWKASVRVADVQDWAAQAVCGPAEGTLAAHWDLIVTNLFLHHFRGLELQALLGAVAVSSSRFCACEPRRSWLALAAARMVGLIGANAVTRVDAVRSVRAGFTGREISALWPGHQGDWHLQEYPAGLFSHCFRARLIKEM